MKILNTGIQIGQILNITIRINHALACLFDGNTPTPHHCKFAVFRRKPRGQNGKGCPQRTTFSGNVRLKDEHY